MERYTPFNFEEASKKDLNELIGEFKAKYGSFKDVKKDKDFKKLSDGDQEYVLDELNAEGTFKEDSKKYIEGKIIIKDEAEEAEKLLKRNKIKFKKLDRFGKQLLIPDIAEYENAQEILKRAFITYK